MASVVVDAFYAELDFGRPTGDVQLLRNPVGNFAERRDLGRALLLADLASRTWLADSFSVVDPTSDNPFRSMASITAPEHGGMNLQPLGTQLRRGSIDVERNKIGSLAFDLGGATNEIYVDAGYGPNSQHFESVARISARCLLDTSERVNDLDYFYREADKALASLISPLGEDPDSSRR